MCVLSSESRFLDGLLPSEYVEGEWCFPSEAEPAAVITYASEPSPETGHAGWCWWALGKMGDAPTYEEAKRRAEEVLERATHELRAERAAREADEEVRR